MTDLFLAILAMDAYNRTGDVLLFSL